MGWQKGSGYNKRSRVECTIGRYRQLITDGLHFRNEARRVTEVGVVVRVVDRMLELGRPICDLIECKQMRCGSFDSPIEPSSTVTQGVSRLRQGKCLNNILERGRWRVKRLTRPGLGFGNFYTARRTLAGYEAMAMIRKVQVRKIGGDDIRTQAKFIAALFNAAA